MIYWAGSQFKMYLAKQIYTRDFSQDHWKLAKVTFVIHLQVQTNNCPVIRLYEVYTKTVVMFL